MAAVTLPVTLANNTVADANDVMNNFNTIVNDYNSNITNANISATAAIVDTKLATLSTAGKVSGTALPKFISGSLTRDVTLASGNVATTGLGVKPRGIIFLTGLTGGSTSKTSWGVDDGTNPKCTYINSSAGPNFVLATTNSIYYDQGGGAAQTAKINSFDTDGFTIAWVKGGSPSADTLTIEYLAWG